MKRIFILLTILFFGNLVVEAQKADKKNNFPVGQGSEDGYYDLLLLYMDGSYENCIKKSLKVNEKAETSKDPMPYLYISMSYYEMSQIEKYKAKFPNAFKDAVKYAIKYYKRDLKSSEKKGLKDLEFYNENKPYLEKLRVSLKELAEISLDAKKTSSAESAYKQILQFDTLDFSAAYMMGVIRTMNADPLIAATYFDAVKPAFEQVNKGIVPEDYKNLFIFALKFEANYLLENGRTDLAKEKINEGLDYYPENEDLVNFKKEKNL